MGLSRVHVGQDHSLGLFDAGFRVAVGGLGCEALAVDRVAAAMSFDADLRAVTTVVAALADPTEPFASFVDDEVAIPFTAGLELDGTFEGRSNNIESSDSIEPSESSLRSIASTPTLSS